MFESCRTLPELKRAYHIAAKQSHPDMGGTDAAMRAVIIAYNAARDRLSCPVTIRPAPVRPAEDWRTKYRRETRQERAEREADRLWREWADRDRRARERRAEEERKQAKKRAWLEEVRKRDPLMAELVTLKRGSPLWELKLVEYCCREDLFPSEGEWRVQRELWRAA